VRQTPAAAFAGGRVAQGPADRPEDQMSAPPRGSRPKRWLEQGLFLSRWLMAPFYVGLVVALVGLLVVFGRELGQDLPSLLSSADTDKAILTALSLIELSLSGNLLLIVIISGYQNFVSKLGVDNDPDRPDWLAHVDFSGLKMKLIASVVVISAIALLETFMDLADRAVAPEPTKLTWMLAIHATFLATGIALALMDRLDHRSQD
jgi:uncharacterized protein (TIGR00645 family)